MNFQINHLPPEKKCAISYWKPFLDFKDIDEVKGRGLIYTGPIPLIPGTEIFRANPWAAILQIDRWDDCCQYCFAEESETEFPVCSGCGIVKYCSTECQQKEWLFHKAECVNLKSILAFCESLAVPNEDITDFLLCCRAIRRRLSVDSNLEERNRQYNKLQESRGLYDLNFEDPVWFAQAVRGFEERVKNEGCVHLGPLDPTSTDLDALCVVENLLKPSQIIEGFVSIASKCSLDDAGNDLRLIPEDYLAEFKAWLCAMQPNNFAITDALFCPKGAGVYPHGAGMNHSCVPNVIVIYEEKAQVQVVRAIKTIYPGDEILHMYCDVALPVLERQISLRATYEFTCKCLKCIGDSSPPGDRHLRCDLWNRELLGMEGINDEFLATLNSHVSSDQDWKAFRTAMEAMPPIEWELITLRKIALKRNEIESSSNCSPSERLKKYMELIRVAESFLNQGNLDLYTLRSAAFHIALLTEFRSIAAYLGLKILRSLESMYGGSVPHHPLISFQYHTLGDIFAEMGQLQRAQFLWDAAKSSLEITHGRRHVLLTKFL